MARYRPFFPLAGLLLALLATGCSKPAPPTPQGPPPPAGAANPKVDMGDHFSKVREVEEAIIRGDMEAAKVPAQWIADHQETAGFPAGTERPVAEMRAAARSVASTDNIGNAAIAAATLVAGCGRCHSASKVSPKFTDEGAPKPGKGPAAHMLEHQYAINRMYRGLVAPESDEWNAGAKALKAAPLGAKALPDVATEAIDAEARVHDLAEKALDAPAMSSRVAIYGSIVGDCASCHGLHGKVWGPGLPKT